MARKPGSPKGGASEASPQPSPKQRRKWTSQEDACLASFVRRFGHLPEARTPGGEPMWSKMKELMPGSLPNRDPKACRLRWTNHLRPGLLRGGLTQSEERRVLELHQVHGNKWSVIAKFIRGRSDNAIKNWWNAKFGTRKGRTPRKRVREEWRAWEALGCMGGEGECDREGNAEGEGEGERYCLPRDPGLVSSGLATGLNTARLYGEGRSVKHEAGSFDIQEECNGEVGSTVMMESPGFIEDSPGGIPGPGGCCSIEGSWAPAPSGGTPPCVPHSMAQSPNPMACYSQQLLTSPSKGRVCTGTPGCLPHLVSQSSLAKCQPGLPSCLPKLAPATPSQANDGIGLTRPTCTYPLPASTGPTSPPQLPAGTGRGSLYLPGPPSTPCKGGRLLRAAALPQAVTSKNLLPLLEADTVGAPAGQQGEGERPGAPAGHHQDPTAKNHLPLMAENPQGEAGGAGAPPAIHHQDTGNGGDWMSAHPSPVAYPHSERWTDPSALLGPGIAKPGVHLVHPPVVDSAQLPGTCLNGLPSLMSPTGTLPKLPTTPSNGLTTPPTGKHPCGTRGVGEGPTHPGGVPVDRPGVPSPGSASSSSHVVQPPRGTFSLARLVELVEDVPREGPGSVWGPPTLDGQLEGNGAIAMGTAQVSPAGGRPQGATVLPTVVGQGAVEDSGELTVGGNSRSVAQSFQRSKGQQSRGRKRKGESGAGNPKSNSTCKHRKRGKGENSSSSSCSSSNSALSGAPVDDHKRTASGIVPAAAVEATHQRQAFGQTLAAKVSGQIGMGGWHGAMYPLPGHEALNLQLSEQLGPCAWTCGAETRSSVPSPTAAAGTVTSTDVSRTSAPSRNPRLSTMPSWGEEQQWSQDLVVGVPVSNHGLPAPLALRPSPALDKAHHAHALSPWEMSPYARMASAWPIHSPTLVNVPAPAPVSEPIPSALSFQQRHLPSCSLPAPSLSLYPSSYYCGNLASIGNPVPWATPGGSWPWGYLGQSGSTMVEQLPPPFLQPLPVAPPLGQRYLPECQPGCTEPQAVEGCRFHQGEQLAREWSASLLRGGPNEGNINEGHNAEGYSEDHNSSPDGGLLTWRESGSRFRKMEGMLPPPPLDGKEKCNAPVLRDNTVLSVCPGAMDSASPTAGAGAEGGYNQSTPHDNDGYQPVLVLDGVGGEPLANSVTDGGSGLGLGAQEPSPVGPSDPLSTRFETAIGRQSGEQSLGTPRAESAPYAQQPGKANPQSPVLVPSCAPPPRNITAGIARPSRLPALQLKGLVRPNKAPVLFSQPGTAPAPAASFLRGSGIPQTQSKGAYCSPSAGASLIEVKNKAAQSAAIAVINPGTGEGVEEAAFSSFDVEHNPITGRIPSCKDTKGATMIVADGAPPAFSAAKEGSGSHLMLEESRKPSELPSNAAGLLKCDSSTPLPLDLPIPEACEVQKLFQELDELEATQ